MSLIINVALSQDRIGCNSTIYATLSEQRHMFYIPGYIFDEKGGRGSTMVITTSAACRRPPWSSPCGYFGKKRLIAWYIFYLMQLVGSRLQPITLPDITSWLNEHWWHYQRWCEYQCAVQRGIFRCFVCRLNTTYTYMNWNPK